MPEKNKAVSSIEKHREEIDAIDRQIVTLLNERTAHSLAIRELKPEAQMGLFDPKREEEIFAKLSNYNKGPLYNDSLQEIYEGILKVMKEMPSL